VVDAKAAVFNRDMTYQSDGKNLTKVIKYFVGEVKLACYCYIIDIYYALLKQIVASNICNGTPRKLVKCYFYKFLPHIGLQHTKT
jgi:hypothetical protein